MTGVGLECPSWHLCKRSIILSLITIMLVEYAFKPHYLSTWSMLLSLIKKSPLSSWFSCYSTTNVIAAGQHGKTELPDEDFAGVFWGVNSARHQLRLLQIPTPSWSSSMDHPNCHWVSAITVKMDQSFELSFSPLGQCIWYKLCSWSGHFLISQHFLNLTDPFSLVFCCTLSLWW